MLYQLFPSDSLFDIHCAIIVSNGFGKTSKKCKNEKESPAGNKTTPILSVPVITSLAGDQGLFVSYLYQIICEQTIKKIQIIIHKAPIALWALPNIISKDTARVHSWIAQLKTLTSYEMISIVGF